MMQNRTIIENLESNMINLTSQITSLNERIGKIDVRDTLKMSFRYLYKILYSKYPGSSYLTNFWEEISEKKRIFDKP